MLKNTLKGFLILLLISSCSSDKQQDPFKIGKHHIGALTDSTQVKDLDLVFANDSVVKVQNTNGFTGQNRDYAVYDETGKRMLIITPELANDSTSTIQSVMVYDKRFKTEKNISNISTFKDVQANYKISKIDNLIRTVVVSVNEINASFTIDKKELPANLRFDMDMKIEAVQIPDEAKIKYFMLHW